MLTLIALYSLGLTLITPLILRQAIKNKKALLVSRIENEVLSDRYLDVAEDRITDWDIDFYLERQGVTHNWKRISRSHMEGARGSLKYKDTLQSEICERCGLIRRSWVHGLGMMDYAELAGYFRGDQKVNVFFASEQHMRCLPAPSVRVLPEEHQPKLLNG